MIDFLVYGLGLAGIGLSIVIGFKTISYIKESQA